MYIFNVDAIYLKIHFYIFNWRSTLLSLALGSTTKFIWYNKYIRMKCSFFWSWGELGWVGSNEEIHFNSDIFQMKWISWPEAIHPDPKKYTLYFYTLFKWQWIFSTYFSQHWIWKSYVNYLSTTHCPLSLDIELLLDYTLLLAEWLGKTGKHTYLTIFSEI
jgi:hypothetical protein